MSSLYFNAEHDSLRTLVRDFVNREMNPYVEAWESAGIFPAHELFKKLGNLGLLGLVYPEKYGGGGMDYWYQAVFLEELGRTMCGGVPMGIAIQELLAWYGIATDHIAIRTSAYQGIDGRSHQIRIAAEDPPSTS